MCANQATTQDLSTAATQVAELKTHITHIKATTWKVTESKISLKVCNQTSLVTHLHLNYPTYLRVSFAMTLIIGETVTVLPV